MKKICIVYRGIISALFLIAIPFLGGQRLFAQTVHTIQKGETLYSIVTKYKISGQSVCRLNPGLNAAHFAAGTVIKIPEFNKDTQMRNADIPGLKKCKFEHVVKRRETLYSISQAYHLTIQELINSNPKAINGIKKGMRMCIPYDTNDISAGPDNKTYFDAILPSNTPLHEMTAAMIYPLHSPNKASALRIKEYIRGMYLAVDSMKRKGIHVDLKCFDAGETAGSIKRLLNDSILKHVSIIFAPYYKEQVAPLSTYVQKHQIKLVIPSLNNNTEVSENPWIFQINTPALYYYPSIYKDFVQTFDDANIVFLDAKDNFDNNRTFILGLRNELTSHGNKIHILRYSATLKQMESVLDRNKRNVFIPISSSVSSLKHWLPIMSKLTSQNTLANISLFGYPVWQTYYTQMKSYFETIDTYFYAAFYTNYSNSDVIKFSNDYHKKYKVHLLKSMPNYAMLGFDTSYFFFNALSQGAYFERSDSQLSNVNPLQNHFCFKRLGMWGGFVNKGVKIEHIEKDQNIIFNK